MVEKYVFDKKMYGQGISIRCSRQIEHVFKAIPPAIPFYWIASVSL